MLIAVTTNGLQHWLSPSKQRPVCHTVRDSWASLSHRANNRRTCYWFFNFWPWGLPLGQRSPKGICPIAQTVYEICATKVFHFLALIFTPQSHPRSNLTVPIESPWLLRRSDPGSNLVPVTVFEIFWVKILTVHLLTLFRITYYPPRSTVLQNFSPIAQTVYEICVTNFFYFLA